MTDWLFTSISLSLFLPFQLSQQRSVRLRSGEPAMRLNLEIGRLNSMKRFFWGASVKKGIGVLEVPHQRSHISKSCSESY